MEFCLKLGKQESARIVTPITECKQLHLEYQSEADKEERVVSSIKVLKRKITEVEEETPQETEAEKVVQASTSRVISKKRYFKRQINKYKLRRI
ncbi:hypothetical protein BpHYR1_044720 [Brachionus plicatilis]|uniref:Uncharacterized protein n=1 Tax=Brachionus plicatilis TaxID=10195 RepID=A0A3M7SI40_BRAPC|nr:hypothetical protein BpHYR1_044720 [Brachionus plicatilis]